ncbi:amino acid ABC transporter permease [Halocynthiibacter namhaensis]|uniref:amino acid ABC transporter permease n=1 Tax=Halocynthiibacter namhaensis TaxID=1290553 RepID=UPI0005795B70|nr:amino acid ABC transporter permease [Halocynthiibacter namhaensis]
MSDISFVRTDMLPEQEPPATTVGFVGWARANLFSSPLNAILSILSIVAVLFVLSVILPWAFMSSWNATSLTDCREQIAAAYGPDHHGACWAVIKDRWVQLVFGFYPPYPIDGTAHLGSPPEGAWPAYFRPIATFVLILTAVAPVLFDKLPRKMLLITAVFPFLMPWMMWGGTFWNPVGAMLGFGIGYLAYRFIAPIAGSLAGVIAAALLPIIWWLFLMGGFASTMQSIIALDIPTVNSRKFGGFTVSIFIGVVAIVGSLPLGIILALGRQSDLLIVKALCVGFIEFIRGVPLITLLFVASTLLNIFLPPGTEFDIILRVLIMVTLFASAYMAEVVRGGLAALPRGQYEAADALGLDYWKAQRLIIMPQALKISIPGIVSTFIGIFKDTTLVSIIAILDPLGLTAGIRANAQWNGIYWELFAFIAFVFFIFCFSMSRYSMYLERKLKTSH